MIDKKKLRVGNTYKVSFKDGSWLYLDWIQTTANDNQHKYVDSYQFICHFPLEMSDWESDGKQSIDENAVSAVDILSSKEELDAFNEYKEYYFENIEKYRIHCVSPQLEEKDDRLKIFNNWLSSKGTQKWLDNWCTPMYGYTDIEVEDMSMVLQGSFNSGWDAAMQYIKFLQEMNKPVDYEKRR